MSVFGGLLGVAGACFALAFVLLGWMNLVHRETRGSGIFLAFNLVFWPATVHLGVLSWQLVGALAGFTGEQVLQPPPLLFPAQWMAIAGQLVGFSLLGLAVGYGLFTALRAVSAWCTGLLAHRLERGGEGFGLGTTGAAGEVS